MTRISSEQVLIDAFRPIDQPELQIPSEFQYPLLIKDYLSWVEPSGHRAYLLLPALDFATSLDNKAYGVVFRRTRTPADSAAQMCEWCHAVRGGSAVALLTTHVHPNRRIGIQVCSDLSCHKKLTEMPNVHDLRESLSPETKINDTLARMMSFARKNIF